MAMTMADCDDETASYWSELPNCLLDLISTKLTFYGDCVRFSSVCTSWRSSGFFENVDYCATIQSPLLLIPLVADPSTTSSTIANNDYNVKNREEYERENRDTMNKRSLYSVTENKICDFRVTVPDHSGFIYGSSFGWLVIVGTNDETYPVTLLNPFLQRAPHLNEIKLPSLHTLPPDPSHDVDDSTLFKAVVSNNPTTNTDYAVMAIYGGYRRLAFWKPGDKKWTIPVGGDDEDQKLFKDIMYYEGRFYAINNRGRVVACDINSDLPKLSDFAPPPACTEPGQQYIIESSGDIFQVHRSKGRTKHNNLYYTRGFKVFKLLGHQNIKDTDDEKLTERKWIKVNTLNGQAFFIGNNASMSISASDFPGCLPNCIYFTDDYCDGYTFDLNHGPHDIGIFNVKDRSFERYSSTFNTSLWPNPIWVHPATKKHATSGINK